jgi:thiol-disulfide isomerase/thioredoxin
MTIAEQVRGLAEGHAAALPAEVKSAFAREQAELAALEPVEVIAVGELLPDSDLRDAHGQATTLQRTLDGRPAVLVFYRGAWCPYCNIALNAYQAELLGELDRRGVTLVALSPQTPDGSLSMQEKNDLLASPSSPTRATAWRAASAFSRRRRRRHALRSYSSDSTSRPSMPTARPRSRCRPC